MNVLLQSYYESDVIIKKHLTELATQNGGKQLA